MNNRTIKTATRVTKPFWKMLGKRADRGQHTILMYHGVAKRPQFNCVPADLLRKQLGWLTERYTIVPLSVLIGKLARRDALQRASKLAALTFDDGYCNFAELALPLLKEYKCHATVFVPSGKTGLYNDWDEGIGHFRKMEIMTYGMLRQLPPAFVEIGSHGVSHLPFNRLTPDRTAKELIESRLDLERHTGRPVRFFAYPFGVCPVGSKAVPYDEQHRMLGGYEAACTTWWGRHNSANERNMLRRVGIWDSDSLTDFADKLNGCYDWLECKEKIGRSMKSIHSRLW